MSSRDKCRQIRVYKGDMVFRMQVKWFFFVSTL